jgi:hypothetical protein
MTARRKRQPTDAQVATAAPSPPVEEVETLKIGRRLVEVDSLAGVRRALVRLADGVLRGTVAVKRANCAVFALQTVVRLLEVEIVEQRLEELEDRMTQFDHTDPAEVSHHGVN